MNSYIEITKTRIPTVDMTIRNSNKTLGLKSSKREFSHTRAETFDGNAAVFVLTNSGKILNKSSKENSTEKILAFRPRARPHIKFGNGRPFVPLAPALLGVRVSLSVPVPENAG